MRNTTLARRYAGALFETALIRDAVDAVEKDLGLVTESLHTMPQLRDAIAHPLIPADRKKRIAGSVFRESVQKLTLEFLGLLIDKRREEIIEEVESEYVRLANEHRRVQPVTVTSAVPLTPEEESALAAKLREFTGKDVEMQLGLDPDLIGGVLVQIGDTVMDGSVKGHLAALREKLLASG